MTNLQLSHHPLDQVIPEVHTLKASLRRGDGVEDGGVDLLRFFYGVQRCKLSHDTLRAGTRTSHSTHVLKAETCKQIDAM